MMGKGIRKDIGNSLEMSHPSLGIPEMAEHQTVSPNITDELGNQSKMNGNPNGNPCALQRSSWNKCGRNPESLS
jgi:hypothetical protein